MYDSKSNTNSQSHSPGIKNQIYSGKNTFFVNSKTNTPIKNIRPIIQEMQTVSTQNFKFSQNENHGITQDTKFNALTHNTNNRHNSEMTFQIEDGPSLGIKPLFDS